MYHLTQALAGIRRAGFMSVACVIIMTCSLLIFGIFLLATANLREILRFAHGKVEIVAFFENGLSTAGADSVLVEIEKIPFVEQIHYVSSETALERLKAEFGKRSYILDDLEENPLPASVEVTLKPQYRLKDRVVGVADRIEQMRGIEDVSYGRGWISMLERIVRVLAMVDIVVGLVVGIAAVVTVSYTVRLTLFARRELIRVLKLVGATDFFVMAPFLLEGLIHGAIALALSAGILFLGFRAVNIKVPQAIFMPWPMMSFFIAFGLIVAVLGSWLSVRAFLWEKE
jgi:cell division transport system permease protein